MYCSQKWWGRRTTTPSTKPKWSSLSQCGWECPALIIIHYSSSPEPCVMCVCDDAKASPMSHRFERWSRFCTVALNEPFQSIYCPVGVIWSVAISITVKDHLRHFKKYSTTDKWQKTSQMLRSVSTGDCCQTPAQARAQHRQPLRGDRAVRPDGREQLQDYCLPWVESGCGAALLSFHWLLMCSHILFLMDSCARCVYTFLLLLMVFKIFSFVVGSLQSF